MNHKKWSGLLLLMLLAACKDDTPQPELAITGHWNIDHGFYEPCQVNASFTTEMLILTFYSHEEDACLPELYGIDNNALTIRIHDKQDYVEGDGTLATTLQVSVPEHQAVGTLSLKESESGLIGDIVTASDPYGFLEPLLEPLYSLTPVTDHWLPLALGSWGAACDELEFPDPPEGVCEVIEFTSATTGSITSYGGVATGGDGGEISEIRSDREKATFALRNLAVMDGAYNLDLVLFIGEHASGGIPFKMRLEDGLMVIAAEDDSGTETEIRLVPMN